MRRFLVILAFAITVLLLALLAVVHLQSVLAVAGSICAGAFLRFAYNSVRDRGVLKRCVLGVLVVGIVVAILSGIVSNLRPDTGSYISGSQPPFVKTVPYTLQATLSSYGRFAATLALKERIRIKSPSDFETELVGGSRSPTTSLSDPFPRLDALMSEINFHAEKAESDTRVYWRDTPPMTIEFGRTAAETDFAIPLGPIEAAGGDGRRFRLEPAEDSTFLFEAPSYLISATAPVASATAGAKPGQKAITGKVAPPRIGEAIPQIRIRLVHPWLRNAFGAWLLGFSLSNAVIGIVAFIAAACAAFLKTRIEDWVKRFLKWVLGDVAPVG